MPHAVIDGPLDLAAWAASFAPIAVQRGGDVLRTGELFAERSGRALLVEALVVEAGRKQPFYVRISRQAGGSTSVRIDPHTHPDRTPAVHALVGEIVASLLAFAPQARLARGSVVVPSAGATHEAEESDEDRQ
jgi:quercetin dioxygenase-like cupin family protein